MGYQLNCPIRAHQSAVRNREKRLTGNPDALSLEWVHVLCDDLAAVLETLPKKHQRPLRELLAVVRAWAEERRAQRVEYNSGLVWDMVLHHYGTARRTLGVDEEDAAQEGLMGLDKAALLFDEGKTYNGEPIVFSTYAVWWVKQRIRRLLQTDRIIHVPVNLQDKVYHGELDMKFPVVLSMDCGPDAAPADDGFNLHASIPTFSDAREVRRSDAKIDLKELMAALHPQDRRLVELRYVVGMTLDEAAEVLMAEGLLESRVSRERVRQIQGRAFKRLRAAAERRAKAVRKKAQ